MASTPLRGESVNRVGAVRCRLREEHYLDPEVILDFARRDTGLDDFGDAFEP